MTDATHADRIDVDDLLLLVVGAHLRAEIADRPVAERLRSQILAWIAATDCEFPLQPIVCTDMWYLNDADLLARPSIIIGEPSVNAAAAYFANRLPTAFVVDEQFEVQLDVEFIDLHACLWGVGHEATQASVEAFSLRYLEAFLRAAHGLAAV